MRSKTTIYILSVFLITLMRCSSQEPPKYEAHVLKSELMRQQVQFFNTMEEEAVVNYVSNEEAAQWLSQQVPLFECPDSIIEQTYYFRWWTFRKHLKETPEGFVFTEFITPVKHAGTHNTISCALGHHIYEGRWLHDARFIDEYIRFWYLKDRYAPESFYYKYSSWAADALYHRFLVNQDTAFVLSLLDELDQEYLEWAAEKQLDNGLYWQYDVRDGMEESISGSRHEKNARPTISSYMYGNAQAIAKIAAIAGRDSLGQVYEQRAGELKSLVQDSLWDAEAQFFKVRFENGTLSDAREAIGYIPWYFNLPDDQSTYAQAWQQIKDTAGFCAPWGLTTAERRHPEFRTHGTGGCEWDGAVWPFATTQTLKGLAHLLNNYRQHPMTKKDYFDTFSAYAMAHQKNGKPYIGEYQDDKTGDWLKGDNPRSRYYNHSGFCDLVINDLVGLKPQEGNTLVVKPLIPESQWDWFCLDRVKYHGRWVSIVWDKTGEKYGRGKGLSIFVDGQEVARSEKLEPLEAKLPAIAPTGNAVSAKEKMKNQKISFAAHE